MKDDFSSFLSIFFVLAFIIILLKCCIRTVNSCRSSDGTEVLTINSEVEREPDTTNSYDQSYNPSQPYQALRNPFFEAPSGTNQAFINASYPPGVDTTYTPFPMPSQTPYPDTQPYQPYPTSPPPYTPYPTNPHQSNIQYSTFTPPPYPHHYNQTTHASHLTNSSTTAPYPTTAPPYDIPYSQTMPLPSYDIQKPSAPHSDT